MMFSWIPSFKTGEKLCNSSLIPSKHKAAVLEVLATESDSLSYYGTTFALTIRSHLRFPGTNTLTFSQSLGRYSHNIGGTAMKKFLLVFIHYLLFGRLL